MLHYVHHLASVNKEVRSVMGEKHSCNFKIQREPWIHRESQRERKKAHIAEYGGLLQVIPKKAAIQTVVVYVSVTCMYLLHVYPHKYTNAESSLKNITIDTVGCCILNKKDELTRFSTVAHKFGLTNPQVCLYFFW